MRYAVSSRRFLLVLSVLQMSKNCRETGAAIVRRVVIQSGGCNFLAEASMQFPSSGPVSGRHHQPCCPLGRLWRRSETRPFVISTYGFQVHIGTYGVLFKAPTPCHVTPQDPREGSYMWLHVCLGKGEGSGARSFLF